MNFRDLRKRADLSQLELAKLAGVEQTTISQIELGKIRDVRYSTVAALASALKLPVEKVGNTILQTRAA